MIDRESVLVAWPFSPLEPFDVRAVSVRAASERGTVTGWSEPLTVEATFTDEWIAVPIGASDPEYAAPRGRSSARSAIC